MVAQVRAELGAIDILVNNAAAPANMKLLVDNTLEDQNTELVTLIGTFNCTRHAAASMIENNFGRIINISSISGTHGMPMRFCFSQVIEPIISVAQLLRWMALSPGICRRSYPRSDTANSEAWGFIAPDDLRAWRRDHKKSAGDKRCTGDVADAGEDAAHGEPSCKKRRLAVAI
jgi:3-oxoacyl-[acyl-carrier protein] reductase